jgi:hypothetical protein
MKLMSYLFDLCYSHFDERSGNTVSDLSDGDGKPAGTLVTIKIRYRHESVFISLNGYKKQNGNVAFALTPALFQ